VKPPTYDELLTEIAALREEVAQLRAKLGLPLSEKANNIEQTMVQQIINEPPTVNQRSSTGEKTALFRSLFRGRDDVYARRWCSAKSGKSGYSPVCLNEWERGVCDKRLHKCAECPNRKLAALDNTAIFNHLSGKKPDASDVIGIYPLTADECCYFLAIDFDDGNWREDVSALRMACAEIGLTAHVERSRSGEGAHVWFFFEDKISAATARKFGSALLTYAMNRRHEITFKSYDRLFPNQDTMPNGGFGNLIALPLQGLARKSGNTLFVDELFEPYPDQWAYPAQIVKLTAIEIEQYVAQLAPRSELGELTSNSDSDAPEPWEKRRPVVTLSRSDFSGDVKIIQANMLYIAKSGVSQAALNRIKRLGAFRNQEFYKAQAMRLPVWNKPRIIDCTEETVAYLCLPRGCESALTELLDSADAAYEFEDKRTVGVPISVAFRGELRGEYADSRTHHRAAESVAQVADRVFGHRRSVTGAGENAWAQESAVDNREARRFEERPAQRSRYCDYAVAFGWRKRERSCKGLRAGNRR
jgi:hypothetical protein